MKFWLIGVVDKQSPYEGMLNNERDKWVFLPVQADRNKSFYGPFLSEEEAIEEAKIRAAKNPELTITIFSSAKTVKMAPPVDIQDVA